MASFESKVSDIFYENPRLVRKIPAVIRQLFLETESEFKRRMKNESEDVAHATLMRLYDILYIDFYFNELDDRFLSWVIEHYPQRFTEAELEEMRAEADSFLDFYEIQEVVPGKGSYIKSLCSGSEGFLKDVSSSSRLVKWDIGLTRCYFIRGAYYATGSFTLFSPLDKKFIIDSIEKARAEFKKNFDETDYALFAKSNWKVFSQIEREIELKRKNRKYYTTYGELQLCEVRFRVLDINEVLEEIKSHKEFAFIEIKMRRDKVKKKNIARYQFNWCTPGIEDELASIKTGEIENGFIIKTQPIDSDGSQMGPETIGNIYLDKFLCRLETRSLELADFAVRHFAQLFGDALIFKRIIKLKHDIKSNQNIEENQEEKEDVARQNPELLNKVNEMIYLNLLDEKIPALNNLSPREACHVPEARILLIDWLKGMENLLERRRLEGEKVISIEKIKKELKIDW